MFIPKCYQQAIKSLQKDEWLKAMKDELQTMKDRHVWDLTEKPQNSKILGSRWVFTIKQDENGNIKRFKSRLVAQGYNQKRGETFDEVYSPVVNFGIIRFFFAILVCLKKWLHMQCDIKCAYLYAPLKEKVYMRQPPGFEENPNLVCLLRKALYGLHQSGREWYFEIHKILGELGFKKFMWCNCAYIFDKYIVLLLYVDDIVIFGKDQTWINKAVNLLKQKFDLKILGKTKRLLGVDFLENEDNLFLHQLDYIDKLCKSYEKFKFPVSTLPIAKGVIFSKTQCPQNSIELEEMSKIPYRSLVGSLSFLASRTRPDISYALNIFSQFQENPGITHWHGLLKLLGYVRYTKDLKLNLSNITNFNLTAYSDADFANNRDDRTSMNGQIIFVDKVPITWRSFKQKSVCLSSMESEFIALTETSKELIWLKHILEECTNFKLLSLNNATSTLFVDNQAAIDFVKSPIQNYRSKHIDVKLFFVRDLVYQELFNIKYIQSRNNLADIFTKPLSKVELGKFNDCVFKT